MEEIGLGHIINTSPRRFFSDIFHDLISDKRHRNYVVKVMLKYLNMGESFNRPRELNGRVGIDWNWDPVEFPMVVGSFMHAFDISAEYGDMMLFMSRYPEQLAGTKGSRFGLEYSFDSGRRFYNCAYLAGSKIFGHIPSIVLYDELADNFRELARAVFESRIDVDKGKMSPRSSKEISDIFYHGGDRQLRESIKGQNLN